MTVMLLRGNYAPETWAAVRADPEIAPRQLSDALALHGCEVEHFFFALDRFDFYAFLKGPTMEVLTAIRQLLMAKGWYGVLEGEFLVTPDVLLPELQAMRRKASS